MIPKVSILYSRSAIVSSKTSVQFSALLLSVLLLFLDLPCLDAVLKFGGWYEHVDCQILPVEWVLVGVEEVTNNDRSVDDYSTGQLNRVGHQCVHQWICREKSKVDTVST